MTRLRKKLGAALWSPVLLAVAVAGTESALAAEPAASAESLSVEKPAASAESLSVEKPAASAESLSVEKPAASAESLSVEKPAASAESLSVEDQLRRAKNEYAYGNYERAVAELRALLYPMRLYSDEQVIETRRYLGLSYYLLDQPDLAREEFIKLLYLEPDYELDPFTVAPPIIELFEAVRKEYQPQLDAQRVRKAERQLEQQPLQGFRRTIVVRTTERSDIATFLPFGIGQFQNGDIAMGLLFVAAEVVCLGLNIGSFLFLRSQQVEGRPAYPVNKADLVQALTITEFASAATLGIVWSLGVFHARINFVPSTQRRTVTDEPLEPNPGSGARLDLRF